MQKLGLISLVLLSVALPSLARRLAKPVLTSIEPEFISAGQEFQIKGSGFIKNHPRAHKVLIKRGRKKYKAKVLAATENALTLIAPRNLAYGDYDLRIRLRTRYLKSKSTFTQFHMRPVAPASPELRFKVISDEMELASLLTDDLEYELTKEIEAGRNELRTYYYEDGYKSQLSKAASFYYLPSFEFEDQLSIESTQPLKIKARSMKAYSIDVSDVTIQETKYLSQHYYLQTPFYQRYLERVIELKPVIISKLKVKSPEAIVLINRGDQNFPLENCLLNDSITKRYEFADTDFIPVRSQYQLDSNLGLNDSGGDSMTLECGGKEIDSFHYDKLDEEGFAIKL